MKIVESAILDTNTGNIFTGHRHHNIIWYLVKIHGHTPPIARERYQQGFITDENTFVNRVDALEIAIKANQIIKLHTGRQLYNEDLY